MAESTCCLYCCLERGRPGGCPICGPGAPGKAPEAHPMFLRPGTLLHNQYLVGRVLGYGGFGVTYLARDERLHLRVAIKEYLPKDCATRQGDGATVSVLPGDAGEAFGLGLRKFLEEGRALARFVDHPNVVSVVTFFEENGTGYLVMRYLDGVTLEQLLAAQGGRLAEREAVPLAMAMLDGLRAVHEAGMLHRDVKPGNVFVTADGQVKLLDFGAARYAVSERSRGLTQIWTPGFAPPEQCHDGGRQGPWTDVYAAGATLYQVLTGSKPPDAMGRLLGQPLPSPAEATGGAVGARVSDAVLRALILDAGERFQTVRAFQAALAPASGAAASGTGGTPGPAGPGPSVQASTGGASGGTSSGSQASGSQGAAVRTATSRQALPPARPPSRAPWLLAGVALAALAAGGTWLALRPRPVPREAAPASPPSAVSPAPVPAAASAPEPAATSGPDRAQAAWKQCQNLYMGLQFGEAKTACEQALAADPSLMDARTGLGWVLLELKETDRALAHAAEVLRDGRSDAQTTAASVLAAAAHTVRGDPARALEAVSWAVDHGYRGKEAKARLAMLRTGQVPEDWAKHILPRYACWAKRGTAEADAYLLRRGVTQPYVFHAAVAALDASTRGDLEARGRASCPW